MVRWVALLFVVQAALLGFAPASIAQTLPRDQFGNVICSGSHGAPARPDAPASAHHAALPLCCTLACPMLGLAGAPPPFAVSLAAPTPLVLAVRFVRFETAAPRVAETPRRSRAPPVPA